ncbi:MAG: sulfite exporter TauE/SafE family protein [Nitrosomonas sp.]|uniref:sulfite exporter TauE/SafE family protein n=1 Tax=Nitrosomonas sp. TaxID=42353 RepID=UPI0025D8630C|nr:sulfite exporter TauE/SafE family protein [Nitrosomonas sp.]MBY0473773.1 sulfite exporter TauE/SafE family protein [Nitrosomonas sp.]
MILLTSILLGAGAGAVLALTGAGGTIIAVPLLIFGLHFTVAESAPIALLAVCLSSAIGALIALRQGKVRYRAAGFIAVTGILVAPAGIWLAQKLPNAPLTVLFALVLFYVAVNMLRHSTQPMAEERNAADLQSDSAAIPCRLEYERGRLIWGWPCVRALGYSGIATGFISGLLGVGGGFVVVPALKRATNLPMKSILATSLAVIALISGIGVASATFLGGMNWPVALPFAAGALAGMLIGRGIADYLAGPKLQQGFAVVSMGIAVWMIVRLFWIS